MSDNPVIMLTVEDASHYLTCEQPLDLDVLRKLGADCTLVARIWGVPTGIKLTPEKPWPHEKTYTREVLKEVFQSNPDTRDYFPK